MKLYVIYQHKIKKDAPILRLNVLSFFPWKVFQTESDWMERASINLLTLVFYKLPQ